MKICFIPSDMDAPGHYRTIWPGRQLQKRGVEVFWPEREEKIIKEGDRNQYRTIFSIDFNLPRQADLYVMQQWKERAFAESGVKALRGWGSATSMDVDDNYIHLPEYNPAFYGTHPYKRDDGVILNRKARRGHKKRTGFTPTPNAHNSLHMLSSVSQVDLVTVSTPFLANLYEPYNKSIKVIRNAVDWEVWDDVKPQYEVERERLRIGWFGAFRYRSRDLDVIAKPLLKFLKAHPDVDFVTNSAEAHDYLHIPEGQRITLGEYDFYDRETGEYKVGEMTAQCDVGLVPMVMNDLNRGKSHLKGMEYNAAGIPFIASPTESYKDYWLPLGRDGVGMLAESEYDWYDAIDTYIAKDSLRRKAGMRGRKLAEQESIQNTWTAWYGVYDGLVGGTCHATARKAISVGAVQKVSELGPLLQLVLQQQPKTIVEIGTARGGTLWAIAQTAPDDALFISMDIPAGSPLDVRDGKDVYTGRNRELVRSLVKPTQTIELLDVDSQTPEALEALTKALGGRRIDLLFIDGDHRYEGVRHDYEWYSNFVAPGGLIAFHDIVTHEDKRVGVHKLWAEIKEHAKVTEFVGPEAWGYFPWGGIGVVHV